MRAVIYARASTKEQGESCADQERVSREKAKALGATVTAVYADDGISGTDSSRPAYQRMLTAANAKQFDTLIVWKLDRLGRDAPEREKVIRRLEFHGVRIVTNKDYDSASGTLKNRKLNRGMTGLIDETFLDNLSEDVHRGQEKAFLKGFWVGGRVYGYKLEPVLSDHEKDPYGKPKQIATLIKVDPAQAGVVKEIFERYSHGASPQTIAADLNDRGIPSPGSVWKREVRRCKGWARSAIWQMLRNPLYTGTYYWDRTQWVKMEGKRVRKARDKAELKGCVGNAPHLAIVKPATWKLAQLRLNLNSDKPKDKRLQMGGRAVYMLSGLLICKCGAHFVLDSATHYACAAARDGRACKVKLRVRRDTAERVILQPLVDELLTPEMADVLIKEYRRYHAEMQASAKARQTQRPAEVIELERRITRLQERLKAGDPDMASDEIMAVIEKAQTKRAALLETQPEAKRHAKILQALPGALKQCRDQIIKGLQGDQTEAGRARVTVRQLLGNSITLEPAKGGDHLIAHLTFTHMALLGNAVGFVGSGGRISHTSTRSRGLRINTLQVGIAPARELVIYRRFVATQRSPS
jgi:site-specific DNA recombinase